MTQIKKMTQIQKWPKFKWPKFKNVSSCGSHFQIFAKTMLCPSRRRREGWCSPDVRHPTIPLVSFFSLFVFLNSTLFCVISTVLWSGATSIFDGFMFMFLIFVFCFSYLYYVSHICILFLIFVLCFSYLYYVSHVCILFLLFVLSFSYLYFVSHICILQYAH